MPKLRDDCETFYQIFQYIEQRLAKKAAHNERREDKYNQLKMEFLVIYGRAQKKEKELEGTTRDIRKRPFYYVDLSHPGGRKIFNRLRQRSRGYYTKHWSYDAV